MDGTRRGVWLALWLIESKLHVYYVSGRDSLGYVTFTMVSRVKAARLSHEIQLACMDDVSSAVTL